MVLPLIEKLGDWNPQLMRELKGRLKLRNRMIVLTISLLLQSFILLGYSEVRRPYCSGNDCDDFSLTFNWLEIFRTLNWILPLVLFSIGIYILIADLVREQRRGTLNFIRLSPQSSHSILLGKVLGVPILAYLGVALTLPLHFTAGILAGVPLGWTIGFYALIGAVCALFYTTAILNTLLNQAPYQAIAGSFLGIWLGSSFLGFFEVQFEWYPPTYRYLGDWYWFFWNLSSQPLLLTLWILITISVSTYWIWQAANRLFHNPNRTMLSKQQSYWLVGSFQIWLLGLLWSQLNESTRQDYFFGCLFAVSLVTLFLFIAVMWATSPQRQTLLDWARYEQGKTRASQKLFNTSWADLVLGKRSPVLVAITLNLAITGIVWLPWVLLLPLSSQTKIQAIAGLILSANLILIYALINQLILLKKRTKSGILTAGTLSVVILLPPVILSAFSLQKMTGIWLFSVFGAPWMMFNQASAISVILSLLGQWVIMGGLSFYLTQQLQRAGESASKSLFASSSVLPSLKMGNRE
ncbi:MAG TPA: hypothetical protein DCL61_07915 [Cyanobacteria bacterium UBA12227]|nr:hypothetical protein [Cyanobacteria bacterium UBA12227]